MILNEQYGTNVNSIKNLKIIFSKEALSIIMIYMLSYKEKLIPLENKMCNNENRFELPKNVNTIESAYHCLKLRKIN